MSGFTLARRAGLHRAGCVLRRIGGALLFLLKGAGLGLGWCFFLFLTIAFILGAGQSDAIIRGWFNHSPMDDPNLAVATWRAAFIVFGLMAMIATYQASKALESWWAQIWPEKAS